jgi:hypothetical protein
MKKFNVMAAQRVSAKKPRRRSRYLTATSSSCSLSPTFPYFWADLEYRFVRTCPTSGMLYGAGWA